MADARMLACQGKAFGIIAVVFIGGVALGAMGARAYISGQLTMSEQHAELLHTPEAMVALERLSEQLALTDDQERRIHSILDECIMSEADLFGQIRDVQAEGRRRILGVLDEEQRERFEDVVLEAKTRE